MVNHHAQYAMLVCTATKTRRSASYVAKDCGVKKREHQTIPHVCRVQLAPTLQLPEFQVSKIAMLVLQEKRMNMKVPIAAPLVWIVMPTQRQKIQVHPFAPLAKPVNLPLRAALNVHLVLLAKQEREKMGRAWIVNLTRRQRTQVHQFAPLAKPVNIPMRAAPNVYLVLLAKQEREKMVRVWIVMRTLNQRARVRQVVTHVKLAIVPMRAAPNVRHVLLVNQEPVKMGCVKIVRMVNSEAAA